MVYNFTIPGHPITKSNFKPKGGGFSADSKAKWDELKEYDFNLGNEVSAQMASNSWGMLDGNIQMMIVVYKIADRGDVQNYSKSICDALEGVLYKNDSCIKILGAFTGGIDKENPRVVIKTSPIEVMDYFEVGTLAYPLNDEMKYLTGGVQKKIKEETVLKSNVKLCNECGLPLFKKKVGNWDVWSCKNDHHYSLGAFS